jgi:single-stranded-DNA-specific exonuclease
MTRENRWNVAQIEDVNLIEKLSKEINIPLTIAKILVNRNIDTYDKAKQYFRPNVSHFHDPFLMDGMEKAVDRTLRAIKNKEKIMIYGDYDVDGTCGVAMLYLFFMRYNPNVKYHIPDRVKEGYGVSNYGIDLAKEFGSTLMITIDCGITANEQVDYANSLGIDFIIADHHEPTSDIPKAYAVLDPLMHFCSYPFKYLSGCGVGFKYIQAIARKLGEEEFVYSFLDFVTLATTADIVPLVGENRTLVKLGLKQISEIPRPGIKALIETAGLRVESLNSSQIVFMLAPRINAVGRLGNAERAVSLLISNNYQEAMTHAQILEEENRNRRKIDEETYNHAQELVENYLDFENDASIILHQDDWHPGVIGIVASRLVEKYYLPTIMMTTIDGVAKGSARSIAGFDIYQALKKVEDKLLQFGGHKYAAGLSVELERLDEFKLAFNHAVKELMSEELLKPEIKIDSEIDLTDITPRFQRILREFAPFAPQNSRPVFLAQKVQIAAPPKIVGKNHLYLKVRQNSFIVDAIGFNLGHLRDKATQSSNGMDVVFSLNESDWQSNAPNGETFPQLKIKDLRPSIRTDS